MDRFNSDKIKELRELNHITQKQLGDLLGISDRAVSKWESGLSKPSGENLISLAKIFNIQVENFFGDSDNIKTKKEEVISGMESLRELYKIGRGPSSSHTIGPERAKVFSIGGGSIAFENDALKNPDRVYKLDKFSAIAKYCEEKNMRLWQYAVENEDDDFLNYMYKIWDTMKESVKNGLVDTGELPGGLGVQKKAKSLFSSQHVDESPVTKENRIVCAYAFAVGEQNASGEKIVTAPTCGAAGILPAVLCYQQQKNGFGDESIVRALMTAGIIGNLIKTNASISGAECGCQAEVGSACAMAAAALGELFELSIDKIEYAAEIAIEHHLGLTCDPICGLVQIPCIERNAVAAMRAINAVNLASFLWNTRKISLDRVIQTMKETGNDMHKSYKETSEAGLAKININK